MGRRYHELKSLGICPYCKIKKSAINKVGCEDCNEKRKFKYKDKIKNNICIKCGKNTIDKMLCEICSLQRNEQNKIKLKEIKSLIFNAYGNKCNCCGEAKIKFLCIDHINNDGAKFRKANPNLKKINYNYYKWIIDNGFPKDLQLLCFNCNLGKSFNGGICPHKDVEDL